MTTIDWRGKGGIVSEGPEIEKLDTTKEYKLKLVEVEYLENVEVKFKDNEAEHKDRFKTVWQVEDHKTKVWLTFNLPLGFLQGDKPLSEKANIVKFAKRFHAVELDKPFHLDDHFHFDESTKSGMRIRARLEKQKNSDFYNIDFESIGPAQAAPSQTSNDADELIKRMLAGYDSSDNAMIAYKKLDPNGTDAKFWLLWNAIKSETPPVKNIG